MKGPRLGILAGLIFGTTLTFGQTPAPTDNAAALLKASEGGDLVQVQALIDQGTPVDATAGKYADTALILAAGRGQLDIVNYLISKGAKLDTPSNDGTTALDYACANDQTACALKLIDAGANVNFSTNAGFSPLMRAATKGNDQVVAALIAHHVNLNATSAAASYAIWWAIGHNNLSTVKLLAEAGADLNPKPVSGDDQQRRYTLFSFVAGKGTVELVDLFLAHGADINGAGPDGITPLMGAIRLANTDVAAHLMDKGADVNQPDADGITPLMMSVDIVEADTLQKFLDHGAKLEAKDRKQRTALMWACYHQYAPSVRFLVEHGADINAADAQGETPLTYAGNRGDMEIVRYLKDKGAERTDVHIIAQDKPNPPLPPARSWALAVGAIYPQTNGTNPQVLGYDTVANIAKGLKAQWNITDKAGFLQTIGDLRSKGHQSDYQWEGVKLSTVSDADFAAQIASLSSDDAVQQKALRASYLKWKDRSGLAWDLCRSSGLVNMGYQAHYINEQEAWNLLMAIAQQTQSSFSSWQEMSDNYLDGREIWANARNPKFEACSQLLLNPNDPNSPWNQNPWKTDLSAAANPK